MFKKCLLLLSLLFPSLAFAQIEKGLMTQAIIKEKCQEVVTDFSNDKISAAFDKLKALWILPDDELEYLEQTSIEHLNLVESRFGSYIGNKLVKEEIIEDVLYKLTYVVKFEKHGLRIRFTFYNGKADKWYLNSFKWDDSLSKLFEE